MASKNKTKNAKGAKKSVKTARSAKKASVRSAKSKTSQPKKKTAKKPPVKKPAKASPKKKTAKKASKPAKKSTAKKSAAATAAEKSRERARLQKEKEREQKAREKERDAARKEKERAQKEREKEKLRLQKEKDKERDAARKEKERAQKEREKELQLKEKEKLRLQKEKEKERLQKEKEREKERVAKEKEKERLRKEKEAERLRKEKEKERLRIQKEKEKERLRKEKEQEAYRKAREAERERVRAEKEAARRALEGRVAQQARRAQRIAGTGRGGSSRVYRPDAVPSQAGTRREGSPMLGRGASMSAPRSLIRPSTPAPPPRVSPPASVEQRWEKIQDRLAKQPERFQREYAESFDMSWIHHDSALEGVVYTYQELKTAVDPNIVIVPDSSLQPVCEEIRRHKKAIEWARELGKNDVPMSAEILKKFLLLLHPEEGDLKSVKYRKEIPQHRLYFHDYAAPDKIAVRIRQAFDWLHGPEPPKLKDPVRVAARLHYDLLRTFPFPQDSGKVARLTMNVLLMRAGLPPVIIHSTERQRYYDALRGSLPTIVQMVNDSMRNAMASIEKVLEEEELANKS